MSDAAVLRLARELGVAIDWVDADDRPQSVAVGALRSILSALGFPCANATELAESTDRLRQLQSKPRPLVTGVLGRPIVLDGETTGQKAEIIGENGAQQDMVLQTAAGGAAAVPPLHEPGYYRLRLARREVILAVAPTRCVTIDDIAEGRRLWGLGVQLYALRRPGDLGIGDAGALTDLGKAAARHGADALALSPVHSLFPADPSRYGPYSPSSRLFLNPLHADPGAVLSADRVAAALSRVEPELRCRLEAEALIDWPAASRAKYATLRALFDDFAARDLAVPRGNALAQDFAAFCHDAGDLLREHVLFEALHESQLAEGQPWSWTEWPAEWRDPDSAAVQRFAATHERALQFHAFLQWIAARSFAAAQAGMRHAGMRIGMIADLAVGMDRGGSHAWARQGDLLTGLSVGAPRDFFNPHGQDWGLTAFAPWALAETGFASFLATLRAVMRHAGGVRIDHIMGLLRLWLIPHGARPGDGAYLAYPIDDLLRLIALESHRHRAVVIGEDLGTVPPAFRERLADVGIAGMDVLWFQREGRRFLPPEAWRPDAVAMTSTHDLPTVAGWWRGFDIEMRRRIGLGVAGSKDETKQRAHDRAALWKAFRTSGAAKSAMPAESNPVPVVDAATRFVARTPAPMVLLPLEDALGLDDQPNLPGTIDEHPNWRRRLPASASDMLDVPQVQSRLRALAERDS